MIVFISGSEYMIEHDLKPFSRGFANQVKIFLITITVEINAIITI
jgi:hypothetical protein